ncbi:MAG: tripartite tricarboxylate transporter substrate binding protein [Sphaerochaetaceae bacterium]
MKKGLAILLMLCIVFVAFAQGTDEARTTAVTSELADIKDAWPTKDVKIIVPNAAGGFSDLNARLFADFVSRKSGKNVIVVNETGGSNTVGFETVRSAKADGTTLLSFNNGALINYYAHKIDYLVTDENHYTWINFIYEPMPTSGSVVAVNADSSYQTLDDLIEAARKNPRTITVGDGYGTGANVLAGMLELAAGGVKFKHVDASDTTSRITGVVGGQFDWAPIGVAQVIPYIESGDIRVLATGGSVETIEGIPLTRDLGYGEFAFPTYGFIAGPKGLDPVIVDAIDAWCQDFCREMATEVEKTGYTCTPWTREEALAHEKAVAIDIGEICTSLGW